MWMEQDVICKLFLERRRIDMRWPFVSRKKYEKLEGLIAGTAALNYDRGYKVGLDRGIKMNPNENIAPILENLAREGLAFPDSMHLKVDQR